MRTMAVPERYDLAGSVRSMTSIHADPTVRAGRGEAWFATRTPDGPGTLRLVRAGAELVATAFGPGAPWLIERADAVAGLRDDVTGFAELAARHPLVRQLAREHSGLRMAATGRIFHHLVPAILGQKVSGKEAYQSYVRLLRHFGAEPPPGPHPPGMRLPPDPAAVAATAYWTLHPMGIEQKRGATLLRVAVEAAALERCADIATATRRLLAVPGIGPWTVAEVVRPAFGDPDAVSVGDYNLKNMVAYALAGEPRADDDRMLELLAPFAGHRGRVCQLIGTAGIGPPRRGPRMPLRSFARY